MSKTLGRTDIALAISTYLLGRGLVKMVSCINNGNAPLFALARLTDLLGWDCLQRGKFQENGFQRSHQFWQFLALDYQLDHGAKPSSPNYSMLSTSSGYTGILSSTTGGKTVSPSQNTTKSLTASRNTSQQIPIPSSHGTAICSTQTLKHQGVDRHQIAFCGLLTWIQL